MKIFFTLLIFLIFPTLSHAEWKFVAELGNKCGIIDITATDSSNCFLLLQSVDSNYIYKTSNQGKTFEQIYKNSVIDIQHSTYYLYANHLVSPTPNYHYIDYFDSPVIQKSIDSGKTFEWINLNDKIIGKIAMLDSNIGIVTERNVKQYYCYLTFDGWKTFKKLDTVFEGFINTPVFFDSNNVQILFYTNKRETLLNYNIQNGVWTVKHDFEKDSALVSRDESHKLIYVDDSLGFLAGVRNTGIADQKADIIYRTTDGGNNWEKTYDKENIPLFGLQDIAFHDKNNGIAVGAYNKVLITNDGGDTWVYERPDIMFRGDDTIQGSIQLTTAWIGKTPFIGTYGGNLYRYEGDFFKFGDSTTDTPPPVLKEPENGAIAQNTGLMMNWQNFTYQNNLIVEIAKDSQFVDIITSKIKHPESPKFNSFTYDGLDYFTKYFWRVGYILTNPEDTVWSETFYFRTRLADNTTLSPMCGNINQNTNLALDWSTITGAEYYRMEYSKEETISVGSKLIDSLIEPYCSLENLDSGTYYYWRAQAFNKDEKNDWSPTCFFKTVDSKTDVQETIPGSYINIKQSGYELIFSVENGCVAALKIEIFDLYGNSIYEMPLSSSQNIDLSPFACSVYFYKLSRTGEIITTGKFTVMR